MTNTRTVKTYQSRIEAELDKGFLESQGIKSIIAAEDAGGMRPFPFSYTFGVELKVLETDYNKARKLLKIDK